MTKVTRQDFLRLSAAAASTLAASCASTPGISVARAPSRTLIRGADLLTMDDKLGEVASADVLLENGKIAAIGKGLVAADAEIVDATDMILMPGMIDGHRHVWESILLGEVYKVSNDYAKYFVVNNYKAGVCFRPEDVHLGVYVGGLIAINSGVTSILDHCHVMQTPEKAEAGVKGALDSGIGGVFCHALNHTPTYGPGSTLPLEQAVAEFGAPADEWHLKHAAKMRAKYFADNTGHLRFGVALSGVRATRDPNGITEEFRRAREFAPAMMTHHTSSVTTLYKLGLIGPDYHQSHAVETTDEELKMMAEFGGKMAATPMVEHTYAAPSIHARARRAGVACGLGIDVPPEFTNCYFEQIRHAFWVLFRARVETELAQTYESHDILSFATIEGARSIGMGDVTGSVTVGKQGDLVLLSTARFGFPIAGSLADRVVNFASEADIDSVWVNGKARKRNKVMLGVDWAGLTQKVKAAQDYVFAQSATITFT